MLIMHVDHLLLVSHENVGVMVTEIVTLLRKHKDLNVNQHGRIWCFARNSKMATKIIMGFRGGL